MSEERKGQVMRIVVARLMMTMIVVVVRMMMIE